ncbi:MAG: hypothetical protein LBM19_02535 [Holosporales bacterium]|jgi:hypothetical protein|nr:hypothetical protein [Holosporales bacterium]
MLVSFFRILKKIARRFCSERPEYISFLWRIRCINIASPVAWSSFIPDAIVTFGKLLAAEAEGLLFSFLSSDSLCEVPKISFCAISTAVNVSFKDSFFILKRF